LVKRALQTMPANQVIDEAGDNVPLADLLADTHSPAPDEGLADTEQLHVLATVLHHLDDRSAVIVRMRFGLDGHEPRTLKQIGAELGLTRERVRQLECGALALLRSYLAA
jgi:RNA polymerase primary sigma factor